MTPQQAIDTIPKRIKVGALVYRIELVDKIDDDESDAQILSDQLLIQVRRSSPNPGYIAMSIIHEVLHAIWTERNLPDHSDEETVVGHFERGFCQIIQDNARAWTWITRCLRAGKKIK